MLKQVYSNVTMLNNNDTYTHPRDANILVQLFNAYREKVKERKRDRKRTSALTN